MEKRAVVKAGVTPSIESGKKSVMIKHGNAYAKDEEAEALSKAEDKLEKSMCDMYTGDR